MFLAYKGVVLLSRLTNTRYECFDTHRKDVKLIMEGQQRRQHHAIAKDLRGTFATPFATGAKKPFRVQRSFDGAVNTDRVLIRRKTTSASKAEADLCSLINAREVILFEHSRSDPMLLPLRGMQYALKTYSDGIQSGTRRKRSSTSGQDIAIGAGDNNVTHLSVNGFVPDIFGGKMVKMQAKKKLAVFQTTVNRAPATEVEMDSRSLGYRDFIMVRRSPVLGRSLSIGADAAFTEFLEMPVVDTKHSRTKHIFQRGYIMKLLPDAVKILYPFSAPKADVPHVQTLNRITDGVEVSQWDSIVCLQPQIVLLPVSRLLLINDDLMEPLQMVPRPLDSRTNDTYTTWMEKALHRMCTELIKKEVLYAAQIAQDSSCLLQEALRYFPKERHIKSTTDAYHIKRLGIGVDSSKTEQTPEEYCGWQARTDGEFHLQKSQLGFLSNHSQKYDTKLQRAVQDLELYEKHRQLDPDDPASLLPAARFILRKLQNAPWSQSQEFAAVMEKPDKFSFTLENGEVRFIRNPNYVDEELFAFAPIPGIAQLRDHFIMRNEGYLLDEKSTTQLQRLYYQHRNYSREQMDAVEMQEKIRRGERKQLNPTIQKRFYEENVNRHYWCYVDKLDRCVRKSQHRLLTKIVEATEACEHDEIDIGPVLWDDLAESSVGISQGEAPPLMISHQLTELLDDSAPFTDEDSSDDEMEELFLADFNNASFDSGEKRSSSDEEQNYMERAFLLGERHNLAKAMVQDQGLHSEGLSTNVENHQAERTKSVLAEREEFELLQQISFVQDKEVTASRNDAVHSKIAAGDNVYSRGVRAAARTHIDNMFATARQTPFQATSSPEDITFNNGTSFGIQQGNLDFLGGTEHLVGDDHHDRDSMQIDEPDQNLEDESDDDPLTHHMMTIVSLARPPTHVSDSDGKMRVVPSYQYVFDENIPLYEEYVKNENKRRVRKFGRRGWRRYDEDDVDAAGNRPSRTGRESDEQTSDARQGGDQPRGLYSSRKRAAPATQTSVLIKNPKSNNGIEVPDSYVTSASVGTRSFLQTLEPLANRNQGDHPHTFEKILPRNSADPGAAVHERYGKRRQKNAQKKMDKDKAQGYSTEHFVPRQVVQPTASPTEGSFPQERSSLLDDKRVHLPVIEEDSDDSEADRIFYKQMKTRKL